MYLLRVLTAVAALSATVACAPRGPVIGDSERPPNVGGTIAGSVSATSESVSLAGRKVTAINEATGARFEETSAANGGYTIKVPPGTYRLELELRAGETLEKRPSPTQVNVGDLDADRDFIVTVSLPG